MTVTKKTNIVFLATAVTYIAAAFLYSLLADAFSIPIYIDLLVSELLIAVVPYAYLKIQKRTMRSEVGHRSMASWSIACVIGITILSMPLLSFMNVISSLFAGNAAAALGNELAGKPGLLNFFFVAVVPAFIEETVFRGFFYHRYRRQGFVKAAMLSALLFGLMHLNFNQFSYCFVLGLILAVMVEATGSIVPAMLMHFMINFQSVSIINLQGAFEPSSLSAAAVQAETAAAVPWADSYMIMVIAIMGVLAAAGTILALLLIRVLARINGREEYMRWLLSGGEKSVLSKRKKEPVLDMYFIGAVLVCLAMMVYQLFVI